MDKKTFIDLVRGWRVNEVRKALAVPAEMARRSGQPEAAKILSRG